MFNYDTFLLTLIGVGLALTATVMLLQQRRTPQSAAAWILAIILLPWAAIPLFFALGFRKTRSRHPFIRYSSMNGGARPDPAGGPSEAFRAYGVPAASEGNRIELHRDAKHAREAMREMIEGAEHELDITFYLIHDDAIGRDFVDRLTAKVEAGLQVRLIIDRLGGFWCPREALSRFEAAGGQLRWHQPFLNWPLKGHMNLRNHRKMIIADRARAWTGGRNVGCEYMGFPPQIAPGARAPELWRDLSFTLEGPSVEVLWDLFRADWGVADHEAEPLPELHVAARPGTAVVQVVPSGPDTHLDPLHDVLVQMIHAATRRVWIATPYYLPTEPLNAALCTAARRGVDVRVMVPARSNQRIADFARGAYLRTLAESGGRVLQLPRQMTHAKAGVIDGAAWAGSANFDVRSMLLNFEVAVFVYDAPSVALLSDWFEAETALCREGVRRPNIGRRLAEGVFRLGAPML
ncbi:phospholipase D-like domain-containing protein [Limimaricola variabilis]|uniref:phospholipase D-like domain-containing protein n=1 Tax=Limimaricola variabilis TaxID=1492771 RepID=UPI002AC99AA2|nr:phospholipase D-like domain-containing protein [Limimaricola variabilis]WPY94863.1 phospholipase D-like domain-containing protein [Limimaricola variabilis]